ncbi:hypothetical protein HYH02_003858 [Chlamydomonas schloesseri]|uniref:Expansin-like EG45 domain-containing protein n=1 Tax=Chlamydomonas schloesseri TaxID=2026947 RepID=A0A836B8X2_9CHLO|nr:hypothetical protein HYH02_003858 [Chlamydomonas schloesseri]|eukprot:KAG2451251.1 hypothetical protein HYH02_003858 [Chlamydomonas schloesseri]
MMDITASRVFEFAASIFSPAATAATVAASAASAPSSSSSAAAARPPCHVDNDRDACHRQQHAQPPSTPHDHSHGCSRKHHRRSWQHTTSTSSSSSATPSASSSSSAAASPGSPVLSALLAGLLLTSASTFPRGALADDGGGGWADGRATFYGNDGGATIDQGSCMYGALPSGLVSTGTDIAAISDANPSFAGSCGRCYEIACREARFSDGYGNAIDRSGGTCSRGGSVIVTITDACPCYYPANEYSNKRWCCGDMNHFDMSYQAFSKIADLGQGVIGIKYRQVPCPGYSASSPRRGGDFVQGA